MKPVVVVNIGTIVPHILWPVTARVKAVGVRK